MIRRDSSLIVPARTSWRLYFAALTKKTHDSTVWRINPGNGSYLPSVYFDNPTAVAYSSDGEFLAVGASDGTVTVFRLEQSGEVCELRTVNVFGGVKSLVFDDFNRQLFVANENNMLVSFFFEEEDSMPDATWRPGRRWSDNPKHVLERTYLQRRC